MQKCEETNDNFTFITFIKYIDFICIHYYNYYYFIIYTYTSNRLYDIFNRCYVSDYIGVYNKIIITNINNNKLLLIIYLHNN